MSLNYLGIAHFPVLHRQFSSPPRLEESILSTSSQDLTQDNKDVLIDRLNDLVARLSKDDLEDQTISAIHSGVDQIELVVRGSEKQSGSGRGGKQILDQLRTPSKEHDDDVFWGAPPPTKNIRMRIPESSTKAPRSFAHITSDITNSRVNQIAKEAESLVSQLTFIVTELQSRREEADHIHDMLVTRAERAAERILFLEYRMAELEDDLDANQSELKFLRIQLQAIEAQCGQYLPRDQDQELTQSILNWKIDWEDIHRRTKARRKKCQVSEIVDDSSTVVDGS